MTLYSLDVLRQRYVVEKRPLEANIEQVLRADSRAGARAILASIDKRRFENRSEGQRLRKMLRFETPLWESGHQAVAGVDEAGLSPLAGPVAAAAVILKPGTRIVGIDDSKKLDAAAREELAREIKDKAQSWCVAFVEVEEIDAINIYHAGLLAMRRAVEGLPCPPQHVLVDARTVPGIAMPQNAFNKGDGLNFTIAAASIIAKTSRDAMMEALDREYPGYGLAAHKGYPTAEHRDAVVRLGPSAIHRMSFPVMHELQGEWSKLFYELRQQLWDAATRDLLAAFESSLEVHAKTLPEVECKKLRLMLGRKWKVLAEA